MSTFVDTSGFYALLSSSDLHHRDAELAWNELRARGENLQTSNYVLVETIALIERRFGLEAVREFQADFWPLLDVYWVDAAIHERAMAVLLSVGRRELSLVDCVSFDVMRQLHLDSALAFDSHFVEQGFRCL